MLPGVTLWGWTAWLSCCPNICLWRQLFWEKKLSGLNAFDIAEELVKTMDLPKGLQGNPALQPGKWPLVTQGGPCSLQPGPVRVHLTMEARAGPTAARPVGVDWNGNCRLL